jgi:hypothetical protein
MATVNKDFKVKNGLVVEGLTATVNNFDILTKKQADQDYIVGLIGGTSTSANTANTVVKRDGSGNFAAGTVTAALTGNVTGNLTGNVTGNVTGTVSSLSNHDTADLAEGTNLYFTDERAQDAIGNNLGTGLSYNDSTGAVSVTPNTYDAYGAAAAAKTAAEATAASDATSKVSAEAALRVSGDAASVATAASDATSKANAAQAAAISAAATALTNHEADTTNVHGIADTSLLATTANVATAKAEAIAAAAGASTSAISAAIATEVADRNTAIGTAVDNLVDGAPALLNTLNELAAAINDDANYTTTITTALGTKAPLASPALTGVPTAPTAAANTDTTQIATTAFAKAEADAAQAAAEATAAADATSKVASEAALRVSGDAASVATAASDATSKVAAEAALRVSGDAASVSTAAADATDKVAAEAALRVSGDAASVATAASDATSKANAAQAAAIAYADALTTSDVAEGSSLYHTTARAKSAAADLLTGATLSNITITGTGAGLTITAENGVADSTTTNLAEGTNLYFTNARAVTALEAVVPNFTEVDINSLATQVAATISVPTASASNVAYAFAKADYRSAEFLVKTAYGVHTEISKVLLTLDTADNIAITEYGTIGTNGSAMTISAGVSGSNVQLLVTTANNSSTVTVVGTLLK